MELQRIGMGGHDQRGWYVGYAPDLGSAGASFRAPSQHFVLLLAADTLGIPGPELVDAATPFIQMGASYVCCWGND